MSCCSPHYSFDHQSLHSRFYLCLLLHYRGIWHLEIYLHQPWDPFIAGRGKEKVKHNLTNDFRKKINSWPKYMHHTYLYRLVPMKEANKVSPASANRYLRIKISKWSQMRTYTIVCSNIKQQEWTNMRQLNVVDNQMVMTKCRHLSSR